MRGCLICWIIAVVASARLFFTVQSLMVSFLLLFEDADISINLQAFATGVCLQLFRCELLHRSLVLLEFLRCLAEKLLIVVEVLDISGVRGHI